MSLSNNDRMPLFVDGTQFELTVQDYSTHWKIRVYKNNKVIGTKDFPIVVYPDNGVLIYTVRVLVRGQNASAS